MRLDKYLAEAGIGTRTEVKKIVAGKKVLVNGTAAADSGMKIDPEKDTVTYEGRNIIVSGFEYYMLNKPAGIVSASRVNTLKRGEKVPEGEERFAVDLIRTSVKTDLFPAGRLDKDTEGLLLITNDGQLAHRLLSPRFHVRKTYLARLSGNLSEDMITELENGVDIGDDKPTLPCRIEQTDDSVLISITEGRYHQIKRMFGLYGLEVLYLKRLTFGPLSLDEKLAPGEYRPLAPEETKILKEI